MFAKAILFAGIVAAKAHYAETSTSSCDETTSTALPTVCYDYVNDCGVAYGGCIPATESPTWTAPACPDSTSEAEEEEDCEEEEEYEEEEEEDCEEYEEEEEEYEESYPTSTIVKTVHYTVTSCPPVVEDCPYGQESTVVVTTTYCPATEPTPVVTVTACPGKEAGYGCSGGEVEDEDEEYDNSPEYTYPPTTASAGCYDGHCGGYGGSNSTMMTYTPAPATTVAGGCSGAGCGGGDSEEATETGAVTAGVAKVGVSVMAIVAAVFAL